MATLVNYQPILFTRNAAKHGPRERGIFLEACTSQTQTPQSGTYLPQRVVVVSASELNGDAPLEVLSFADVTVVN